MEISKVSADNPDRSTSKKPLVSESFNSNLNHCQSIFSSLASMSNVMDSRNSSVDSKELERITNQTKQINKIIKNRMSALSTVSDRLANASPEFLAVPNREFKGKVYEILKKQQGPTKIIGQNEVMALFQSIQLLEEKLKSAETILTEKKLKIHELDEEQGKLQEKLEKIENYLKSKAEKPVLPKDSLNCIIC